MKVQTKRRTKSNFHRSEKPAGAEKYWTSTQQIEKKKSKYSTRCRNTLQHTSSLHKNTFFRLKYQQKINTYVQYRAYLCPAPSKPLHFTSTGSIITGSRFRGSVIATAFQRQTADMVRHTNHWTCTDSITTFCRTLGRKRQNTFTSPSSRPHNETRRSNNQEK